MTNQEFQTTVNTIIERVTGELRDRLLVHGRALGKVLAEAGADQPQVERAVDALLAAAAPKRFLDDSLWKTQVQQAAVGQLRHTPRKPERAEVKS